MVPLPRQLCPAYPARAWALDFRQEVVDVFCSGYEAASVPRAADALYGPQGPPVSPRGVAGPLLVRKAASLMKHPKYRDAHATDDHFIPTLFVAGLCGAKTDEHMRGEMGAEDWELTNMCNSQFTLGSWKAE